MPKKKKSRSKGKGKASKANKASNQGGDVGADVAESLDSVLTFENQMSTMRTRIISSLGDGYDTQSLQNMDKKLCNYFLDEDSFYYDDDNNTKNINPPKPTDGEVVHYKQSLIIRKGVLRKAASFEATSNFLRGQGVLNLQLYEDFYEDIMTYHYAWFELIFKESRTDLLQACGTIVKFATIKLESGADVDEVHKIIQLLEEMKDMFLSSVKDHDKEGCEDAGILEYDFYELQYKMSLEMTKANRKDEAEQYFEHALSLENCWGYYEDRYCATVLEFAIGKQLSEEDIFEIEEKQITLEGDEGFYYRCLQAFHSRQFGIVVWNSLCNSSEDSDTSHAHHGANNTDLNDDSFLLNNEGNFNSHNEVNQIMHHEKENQWRAILDDPNSTKAMRDVALSQLNDKIGEGDMYTGKTKILQGKEAELAKAKEGDWSLVEDFELGNWGEYNGNAVVGAAAEEILSREIEDERGPIPLSLRGVQSDGSLDFLSAYPKTTKACKRIIDDSKVDNELKSNAYTVLSYLQSQTSFNDIGGEAMEDLKKAVFLNPSDWRLHSAFATRNMAIYNTSMALESIIRAQELTTDDFATFSLGIRRGKIFFNLNRYDEAIVAFEDVIALYDDGLKDHVRMTDKLIGRLAVAEYMLVQLYSIQGKHKKAINHYRDAEDKRNGIDEEISKTIDWSNRTMAEVVIAHIRPGNLAQGECHSCGEVTDKPLRCAACKMVFYCSKKCQVSAWKQGHKKECKNLKSERDKKESSVVHESNIQQNRVNLPPLDVNLDPKSLWKEGVVLSKKGNFEDAAWKFLLALFMDAALDASNDMESAIRAVQGCKEDNPVAMALSVVSTHGSRGPHPNKQGQRSSQMYEKAITMECSTHNIEMSNTVDDVDRYVFGVGMCFIMHARMLGRAFACKSAADARNKKTKDAFEDIARLVAHSSSYIDPQRWLTLQFELGYSNMNIGGLSEAEKWLSLFKKTLEKTRTMRIKEGAKQHWSDMQSRAESRIQQLPLMKALSQNNPGFLQDCETSGQEDCTLM